MTTTNEKILKMILDYGVLRYRAGCSTLRTSQALFKESSETFDSIAGHIATLEAEIARLRKDAERLDKLDSIGIAYGFEDMHEGNTWTIGGAYSSVRDALDGFSMADTSMQSTDQQNVSINGGNIDISTQEVG